jgi:hypothetical protein
MAPIVRSLYAYDLHGHDANGPLSYTDYFTQLSRLPVRERVYLLPRSRQVVAIPDVRRDGDVFELRFVEGTEGELPLFYDPETGAERLAEAKVGELAVQAAWLVVDVEARLVIQERRRPGVPLNDAVAALMGIGRDRGFAPNPTLSVLPLVSESFTAEVESLQRIKSASMTLAQPNVSWRDAADSLIAQAAADSNAAAINLGATARPKESLAKEAGIVAEINDMVGERFSPLRSAKIVGRRSGESKDRTVSTRSHARREDVEISEEASPGERVVAMLRGARDYLRTIQAERLEEDIVSEAESS